MENDANKIDTLSRGYRGAAIAQPLEAPNDFQASALESYHPSAEGGYQQQEQISGYQQPYLASPAGYSNPSERPSIGMGARTASWLSYLGGWVTGLLFLLLKRENRFVRFHAMQSLLFFGTMSMVTAVFSQIPFLRFIGDGLGFVSFICWLVLMIAAVRGRYYKLPLIGEYAEKWANARRS